MIRKLDSPEVARKLRSLTPEEVTREAYYRSVLEQITAATDGIGGVAWDCRDVPFREICHHHADQGRAIRLSCSAQEHIAFLETTHRDSQPQIGFPKQMDHSVLPENGPPVILLSPVRAAGQTISVVEVFLPAGEATEVYQESLMAIVELCHVVAEYETAQIGSRQTVTVRQQPAVEAAVSPAIANLDTFTDQIHSSLEWKETAAHIANETRRVLQCDRVTVVQFKRNRAKTLAVSGQPAVNRRSNTVRGLEHVAQNVLRIGDELWYPSDEALPPQIERELESYLLESVAKSVAIIPLMDRRVKPAADNLKKEKPPRVIGGLIVEYLNETVEREKVSPQIALVSRHCENALRNAYWHRHLFLYWLWSLLGKSKVVTTLRNLPISLAVLAGIIVLACILVFVPADFNISSPGTLLPTKRDNLFAQTSGTVKKIDVEHRSQVSAGQTLLQMESNELRMRIQQTQGEINESQDRLDTIEAAMLSGQASRMTEQERIQLPLEKNQIQSRLVSLKEQMDILDEQKKKLDVVARMDGTVLSWNVQELLNNRPVKEGELLLEIADLQGGWELELDLPDRRIGHVLDAQEELKENLEVTFVLASDPSQRFKGHITQISQTTKVDAEKGQSIRISVSIEAKDIPFLQTKTGVIAKIHCGRRSLGYVWLHDVFEFVQTKWFQYF